MLKKSITYKDLDDNSITEDFYFNLSKAELAEWMLVEEGLEERLTKIGNSASGREIVETFKQIIRMSVGRRGPDGKSFDKSEPVITAFMSSDAYSELFMELMMDPDNALNFFNGVIPADLRDKMAKGESLIQAQRETIANLPDKDWAAKEPPANPAFTELPSSGRIDMIEGEVVTGAEPTPFPQSLSKIVDAQEQAKAPEQPAWLKEMREPTPRELIAMDKSEMTLAFKMKEEGKFNSGQDKPV